MPNILLAKFIPYGFTTHSGISDLHGQESVLHIYSVFQTGHSTVETVLQFLVAHFAASPIELNCPLADPNFLEVSLAYTPQLQNVHNLHNIPFSIVLHECTERVEPIASHIQQQVTEFALPFIAVRQDGKFEWGTVQHYKLHIINGVLFLYIVRPLS